MICLFAVQILDAQENEKAAAKKDPDENGVWSNVDEPPLFPGCEDIIDTLERQGCAFKKLMKFVGENFRYPAEARRNRIGGKVIVSFVIDVDGYPGEATIVRSLGYGIDEEALRLIERMQDANMLWIPGKQDGKPVRTRFNLPLNVEAL